jgi:hypothetical protein
MTARSDFNRPHRRHYIVKTSTTPTRCTRRGRCQSTLSRVSNSFIRIPPKICFLHSYQGPTLFIFELCLVSHTKTVLCLCTHTPPVHPRYAHAHPPHTHTHTHTHHHPPKCLSHTHHKRHTTRNTACSIREALITSPRRYSGT